MPVTVPVDFDGDASGLEKEIDGSLTKASSKAGASGAKAGKAFGERASSTAKKAIGTLGGFGLALGLKEIIGGSLDEAREAQKVGAATAQLVKQTGGNAKVSADQIGNLATSLSNVVGIDDELIQSGENVLLGFKAIRNEVGKGNDVFNRATTAAVDLSKTDLFKGNLTAASKLLGKALNDPAKGMAALRKTGVEFTADQQKQVKALVATGDVLGAQKILLGQVEARYKGFAASQATAGDKAKVAFLNVEEALGTALLPALDDLSNKFTKDVAPAITDFISDFQKGTGTAGDIRDALTDVVHVGEEVVHFFSDLPGPVKKFAIEGLIAYGVLRKLQSGFAIGQSAGTKFLGSLSNGAGVLQKVEDGSYKAGVGIRNLAGAGGLVLLTQSLQEADSATSTFDATIGGALSGLAVSGNPIGAAAGAIIGFGTSLFRSGNGARAATTDLADFSKAVDINTGKLKKNILQQIISQSRKQDPEAFQAANALGFSDEQVAKAIGGNKKVQKSIRDTLAVANLLDNRVTITGKLGGTGKDKDLQVQIDAVDELKKALFGLNATQEDLAGTGGKVIAGSEGLIKSFGNQISTARQIAAQVKAYNDALDGLPKNVQTKLTDGNTGDITERRIRRIAALYHKTPAEVRTLLSLEGYTTTNSRLNTIITKLGIINTGIGPAGPAGPSGPRTRATGGPVRAGEPYIVGERRPELFVPDSNGRIIPQVPGVAGQPSITINNTYTGPTTSKGRQAEADWNARYSTRARGYQVVPV